jgi:beta-galactosidase
MMLVAGAWAEQKTPSKPFDLIEWNGGKFVYGVDYYPEAWPESQWEKDAQMMQDAGINFVRMAEFAWVKMEPQEGQFDFSWLDRALKILNAHGIKAVLGTPTASPPAWLYARYPDIAAMDAKGVRYRYGSRRDYSLHSKNFLLATTRIVTAMAEHYKNHPGVMGWQIDNELGGPKSYDPATRAAFQEWSERKYKTLGALNQAWGTVFWGHTYQTWSEIPLPGNTLGDAYNPALALDFSRFHSDSTREYLELQTKILRKIAPKQAITHNEMGMYDGVDYYDLSRPLDFVAWDDYPMFGKDYSNYMGPALAHDLMRGAKQNQNFMVMEQQGGLPGWSAFWGRQAAPGLYRVWAYQSVAHGADGVCYFRWRTSRYGTEQYWQGVLDQDSYPNDRYKIVSQTGHELARLTDLLHGSKVVSPVAILVSPDSRWAFQIQPLVEGFDYNRQLHHFYDAFRRAGVSVDVAFPQSDLSSYKVLVAPALFVLNEQLLEKLKQGVKNGATLILTYRSGVKDAHNEVTDQTLPGPLAEMAGIAIHDFDPHINQEQEVVGPGDAHYPAGVWYDILTPSTAETLATYGHGFYNGKAAITENTYGQGRVYYVGTESPSPELYDRLVARAAQESSISLGPVPPAGVEVAMREKDGKKIVFLLNYNDKPQTVSLGTVYENALTGATESRNVEVPAWDVKVLTKP